MPRCSWWAITSGVSERPWGGQGCRPCAAAAAPCPGAPLALLCPGAGGQQGFIFSSAGGEAWPCSIYAPCMPLRALRASAAFDLPALLRRAQDTGLPPVPQALFLDTLDLAKLAFPLVDKSRSDVPTNRTLQVQQRCHLFGIAPSFSCSTIFNLRHPACL